MKAIAQEHLMGCGIACCASLLNIKYSKALSLFNKSNVSSKGFFCKDLVSALSEKGLTCTYSKLNNKNKNILAVPGTIVFIKKSKKYPAGHYLLKTRKGWMDPWINYPKISKLKAGFRNKLPDRAEWIIYLQQLS